MKRKAHLAKRSSNLDRGAHVDEDQHIHVSELPAFCAAGSPACRCAEILRSPAASDVNPELRKATYGLPTWRETRFTVATAPWLTQSTGKKTTSARETWASSNPLRSSIPPS